MGYITKISQRFASGFPDCIALADGSVSFIELKVKPNKPTKLQQHVLEEIMQAGGNAFVLIYYNKMFAYKYLLSRPTIAFSTYLCNNIDEVCEEIVRLSTFERR